MALKNSLFNWEGF